MDRKDRDSTFDWQEPNDYISWHINLAKSTNTPRELDPVLISRRLLPINFAAIHTTVFTVTNTLLDLVGSDPACGYIPGIAEECSRVFASEQWQWSKPALARLVRTDSAIRDSMRISGFMTRGMLRKVTAPAGLANEKAGWTLPQNAFVGTDVYSVHMDPEIYQRPEEYDAFRFSREREDFEQKVREREKRGEVVGDGEREELLRLKGMGLVTTSETFLPFGHGRHACPGRFFVSTELKMLISHLVRNYDIEPLPSRPKNKWFGQNVIPPMKQTIRVRRKADDTSPVPNAEMDGKAKGAGDGDGAA
ncbi:hypothetical protein LTS18_008098 [Coniosporium uncinatum]|uniref:Uncharacterized protein n=1 Tax=Coniosporium uncinatum TaxID=93489 RepID=A0ACC3D1X8_9PEZI|nr:hypothetical protein LTS18_008098 [Coniosporium uncinatum]